MFPVDMMNYIQNEQAELPARAAQATAEITELDRQLASLNNLLGSLHALNDMEAALPQLRVDEERLSNMSNEQGEQVWQGLMVFEVMCSWRSGIDKGNPSC